MPLAQDAPYSDVTYQIIGPAMAVHIELGAGHKERVHQDMLTDEMTGRGLTVTSTPR